MVKILRRAGSTLFEDDSPDIKITLRNAVKQSANLGGANLRDANLGYANLRDANLGGANLRDANLGDANLRDANLRDANLGGANLRDANLRDANLGAQWIIQGQTRSDGYAFFLQRLTGDAEPMVKAGCRHFTLAEAQAHWAATRGGTPLGNETRAIIRAMVDVMHIRGLK